MTHKYKIQIGSTQLQVYICPVHIPRIIPRRAHSWHELHTHIYCWFDLVKHFHGPADYDARP